MKITVFSAKGGVGKTPISTNIVLDRGYALGTNETYHVYENMEQIPDNRLLAVSPSEEFPPIPKEVDIVFDLSGALGGDSSASIRSALQQSDVVLVPIANELKSIVAGFHTIMEVREINPNIVIIATQLKKHKNEMFSDWADSRDFKNIHDQMAEQIGKEYPAFPLKYSLGYDAIFDKEMSLRQIVENGGIDAYTYRVPAWQFDKIYEYLDRHYD